jgi:hypothetical protein
LIRQPISYRDWAAQVADLAAAVRKIDALGQAMGLAPAAQADWHGNLFQKLLPQLTEEPFLVVAITGGTNTGKSAVFNHLVGSRTSLVDPNATQTRHPVCSAAKSFLADHRQDLARVFSDFELRPWRSERDAVDDGPTNSLIVREDPAGTQPERLLLLDTPDVDGTLKENWRLAELVRHAADVLVCVLTQQKYNDAAVRDFFRPAAAVDKTVLIVFNMVSQPETPRQREVVGGWLKTFCAQTGVDPMHVYIAPWDEQAVEANRLPFYPFTPGATNPRQDLADLQFDAIKIRSFRGSLRGVLDISKGLPAYLASVRNRARDYAQARESLCRMNYSDRLDLPPFPPRLLMNEIWSWLGPRRTRFDRFVHGAYAAGWSVVRAGYRKVQAGVTQLAGGQQEPEPDEVLLFQQRERDCLRIAVARWLDRLNDYRRVGSELLKAELEQALSAVDRQHLFDELEARHSAMPMISDSSRQFIHEELDSFERRNPRLVKTLTTGLLAAAVARPVASVTLGYMGGHAFDHLAWHVVVNWLTDFTAGAAGVAVGEAAAVQTGQLTLVPLIRRLYSRLYQERTEALFNEMNQLVLGPILGRLDRFAAAGDSDDFQRAIRTIDSLRSQAGEQQPT